MQAPEQRLRYQDLDQLDPEQRWELIDGIAYAMSSPALVHQLILGELHVALKQHFRGLKCQVVLAPFDVKLRLDLAAIYAELPPNPDPEAVRESPPVYASSLPNL